MDQSELRRRLTEKVSLVAFMGMVLWWVLEDRKIIIEERNEARKEAKEARDKFEQFIILHKIPTTL